MSNVISCPDVKVLTQLLLGTLQGSEREAWIAHLQRCSDCAARLQNIHQSDTLLEALRVAQTIPDGQEKDIVAQMVAKLRAMMQLNQNPGSPNTGAGMPEKSVSTPPFADVLDEPEESQFLLPAQEPGELVRLGPYRILKVLGAGGMGKVYEAEDTLLCRKVALKVMKSTIASNAVARQRFLQEAKTAAQIEHDNIVPIFQVGEDRGIPFLAMPLLQGRSLDDMLRKSGRLCPKQIVHLGLQIAEGLKAAHERGMIHRDIKPGNLWFEPVKGGRIKILDFGLARSLASNVQLTQSGAVLGTPAYMAPEQASAKPVDHRCDLFSLGCVLYQMATGERPFVGEDTMSVLMALARYDPTPPRQLNTEIPPALSDLIMHLLEKDPNKRISSAAEVIKALTKLQKQHAVQPEALSVPKPPEVPKQRERKLPDVSEPETKTLPLATKKARDRSPRAVLLGIGVAFALLACVLGGTLLFFGTTIIRIATNKGELVVEADGDDVEITVKQGGVVIVDRKKERSFVLTAQGGEVEFFDPSSGVRLLTKEFKLDRGGKTVVRVREELALARIPVEKEDKKKDPPPKDVPAKEEKKMADEKKETKKDDKITKPPDKEIKVVIERPPAKTITNSLGMALVYIPPGKFLMGSPKSEGGSASEKPQHEVEITRGFYLGKYEVTQGEYEAVMRTNPSYFSAGGGGKQTVQGKDTSRFPVDTVSWQDAKDFCRKLTERERKEGKLPPNEECGLPTEAEWEYACRGGTKKQQAYHYGATLSPKEANINIVGAQQLGRTEKVGSYEPNGFGLYDMHGNVWEWCEDRYNEKEYQRGKCKDPSGPLGGSSRVVRGGGWMSPQEDQTG